jgi:hypothetical protein
MILRMSFGWILIALLWICPNDTRACEHIPSVGPESLDFEVTVRDTGQPVYDGMVLPSVTFIRFQLIATAFGSCQAMASGPNGCVAGTLYQRLVAKIAADVAIDSTAQQGTYSAFSVTGRDPDDGTTEFYHVLDTHDLSTTPGPRDELLYAPGKYTFEIRNHILDTVCYISPNRVVKRWPHKMRQFSRCR